MEGNLYSNPFEERENSSSDNSTSAGGSPPSTIHAISSPKTRRGIQKRVVTIPIKGDYTSTTPPSDSWAWRKYGQKPIKGSPYPRGYYRCSSSKGCPARKQVERSHTDPSLLLVTYSYDHNHSFPVSRNHPNSSITTPTITLTTTTPTQNMGVKTEQSHLLLDDPPSIISNNNNHTQQLMDITGDVDSLITTTDEFDWTFATMETTSSAILDDPIFSNSSTTGHDLSSNRFFPMMGDEEESLFADLGELPECSVVRMRSFQPPGPWCESS